MTTRPGSQGPGAFVLSQEQVRAAIEGVHVAGRDGRPITTAGHQIAESHETLRKQRDELAHRLHLILSTVYSANGYLVDGEIDTAAKFRLIERLARFDWGDECVYSPHGPEAISLDCTCPLCSLVRHTFGTFS